MSFNPFPPLPTMSQKKEELRKKFTEFHCHNDKGELTVCSYPDKVFDFFYAEIEKLQASEDELCLKVRKEQNEGVRIWKQAEERDIKRLAKISHLESVILAADKLQVHLEYVWARSNDSKGHCHVTTMERGEIETDLKNYQALKEKKI